MIHGQLSGLLEPLRRWEQGAPSSFQDFEASARAVIARFVAQPKLIQSLELQTAPGAYARNLLFDGEEMSAWAIVWDRGSRTPIHDHHCYCCFGVVSGEMAEVQFKPLDETRAVETRRTVRKPGDVSSMTPFRPNIHQMVNDGGASAISLHFYNFTPRLHASSVNREYRLGLI
jgi:predicted metal-dependent enzyme (double-stranded beta helix superfamily)